MSLLSQASLIVTPNGYKEGKLYSVIPSDGSGDMSVTRATTATRVNSAGLVELVPYNLVQYSEQFDNAAWSLNNATITANQTTAPNGTLTADTLTANGVSGFHRLIQTTTVRLTTNSTYTTSIYAKKNTNNFIQLVGSGPYLTADVWANFDLENGVVGSVGALTTASIQSVGNGWYRCNMTAIALANDNVNAFASCLISSATSPRFETNTLSTSVFIWGAQLVEGSVAKDYQKTETKLNIPRLDYSNGTCPSLLVEPQRTNLALWSSSFDNAAWVKTNAGTSTLPVVTANYAASPDGTQNADRIQCYADTSSASNSSLVGTDALITLSATGTFTIYLKSNTSSNQNVLIYWSAGQGQVFSVTPEWQRFTLSNLTAGTAGIRFGTRGGTGNFYSGGDATLDILAYGAQFEAGSYATSYIPTTSASVTRNADAIYKTGISSLIGQTEGVAFIDFVWNGLTGTGSYPRILELWADSSNYIQLFNVAGTSTIYWDVYNGGSVQFSGNATMNLGHNKIAIAYKLNDIVIYKNGSLIASDTTCTIPTTSALGLTGTYNGAGGAQLAASINSAALWKTRLTNDELASLTSL